MKTTTDIRVLQELLETAEDLKKYGLATDEDLAKLKALQAAQDEPPRTSQPGPVTGKKRSPRGAWCQSITMTLKLGCSLSR